ncbi:hypothetical protein V8D89_000961 [Ganoderma adspersum]
MLRNRFDGTRHFHTTLSTIPEPNIQQLNSINSIDRVDATTSITPSIVGSSTLSPSILTSAALTDGPRTSHLTAGGGAGLGAGIAIAGIGLVLASVAYLKRRRQHPPLTAIEPFTESGHRNPRSTTTSDAASRELKLNAMIFSADVDIEGNKGDQEMLEEPLAHVHAHWNALRPVYLLVLIAEGGQTEAWQWISS